MLTTLDAYKLTADDGSFFLQEEGDRPTTKIRGLRMFGGGVQIALERPSSDDTPTGTPIVLFVGDTLDDESRKNFNALADQVRARQQRAAAQS